ncbi:hypothetical protein T4D_343 [Trichinella pseudospiralis]|uniref:Transmembrane protein n=1 Tax=Trichinella pseudospiralis TaxID=6337 RepID=A0A0V1G5Q9_TRIPS|nr:hypothetical protein T4D_343 [Trichinella pseudospiralis]
MCSSSSSSNNNNSSSSSRSKSNSNRNSSCSNNNNKNSDTGVGLVCLDQLAVANQKASVAVDVLPANSTMTLLISSLHFAFAFGFIAFFRGFTDVSE